MRLQVNIASLDCTQHSAACASLDVRGYPTLLLFKGKGDRASVKYSGAREVPSFVSWLSEQTKHE